jgi:hypothetical protein
VHLVHNIQNLSLIITQVPSGKETLTQLSSTNGLEKFVAHLYSKLNIQRTRLFVIIDVSVQTKIESIGAKRARK